MFAASAVLAECKMLSDIKLARFVWQPQCYPSPLLAPCLHAWVQLAVWLCPLMDTPDTSLLGDRPLCELVLVLDTALCWGLGRWCSLQSEKLLFLLCFVVSASP